MKGSRKNHLYNSSFVLSFNGFWIYNKKYQKYQTGQSKKRKYKITAAKIKDDRKKHIKTAKGNKEEYYSKKILINKTGSFLYIQMAFFMTIK